MRGSVGSPYQRGLSPAALLSLVAAAHGLYQPSSCCEDLRWRYVRELRGAGRCPLVYGSTEEMPHPLWRATTRRGQVERAAIPRECATVLISCATIHDESRSLCGRAGWLTFRQTVEGSPSASPGTRLAGSRSGTTETRGGSLKHATPPVQY